MTRFVFYAIRDRNSGKYLYYLPERPGIKCYSFVLELLEPSPAYPFQVTMKDIAEQVVMSLQPHYSPDALGNNAKLEIVELTLDVS